jgi:protein SCO1/2
MTALLVTGTIDTQAGLTPRDLAAVSLAPPPDAAIPLGLEFRSVQNRRVTLGQAIENHPTLLLFVDYTCRTICGPALAIASGALSHTGLKPARDFRLVVVGIDPKDSAEDALAMSRQIEDTAVENATTLLLGYTRSIEQLTKAVGYRYQYDAAADQFAHPAGAVLITPDGRVAKVLSSLALNPRDLHLALVEAGEGHIGTFEDRLTLLCYGFDAVHGVYTPAIQWLLRCLAAITVIALIALLLLLRRYRGAVGGAS